MVAPSLLICATWAITSAHDIAALGRDSLDDDERAHALALRSESARAQFVTRRVQLRDELASVTGIRHEDVSYWREPCAACGEGHGRPRAIGHDGYFSTSSTPHVTALAFADVPVGIDVEALASPRTLRDVMPLLHPAEQASIEATHVADAEDGRRAFTRIWTRKEALLKATGEGLNAPLDRDDLSDPATSPVPGWCIGDLTDGLDECDGPSTFGAWAMLSPSPARAGARRRCRSSGRSRGAA